MGTASHESDPVIVLAPTHDLYEDGECDEMEQVLMEMAGRGARVVINLSGMPHLTARCLGILAHAHQVASGNGGCIVLCGVTRVQGWLLRKTGLAAVLSVHTDVAAATNHVASHPRAVA